MNEAIQTPIQNPVTQTPKINWLLLIFMGMVILVMGIGIGLFFGNNLSPTPQISPTPTPLPAEASAKEGDPTASWKMYTNKELGFNLKYPSDWVIDFEIENANILNLSSANSVLHILNFEDKSINTKEYLSKLDRIGSVGIKNTKEAVVGGLNASQRLEGPFGSGFYLWSTYFKNGDSFFQITIEPKKGVEVRTEDFDIYNQILSTFKFFDQNSDPESKFCGGFTGIMCSEGYACKMENNYPDAGGICIKNSERKIR